MRRTLALPLLILAGLAVFVLRERLTSHEAPAPIDQSATAADALNGAGAYVVPFTNPAYASVRNTTVRDPLPDATAAIVYQLDTETVLWSRNAVLRIPVASLTKVLSALVTRDLWPMDELITVSSASVRVDGMKQTLSAGEQLEVRDLLTMMLVESSNDAAAALADHARNEGLDFVSEMNRKAWVLGMRDCAFRDAAGLDDTAYCTAADMVTLVRAALRQAPDLWPVMASASATVTSKDGIVHTVTTTNELLDEIPGIIGGKTGNTDGALGCFLLVVQSADGRDTLITIVLGSRQRFSDTRLLVEWASAAFGFK